MLKSKDYLTFDTTKLTNPARITDYKSILPNLLGFDLRLFWPLNTGVIPLLILRWVLLFEEWSNSLVYSLKPGVPGSNPSSGQNFVFRNTLIHFGIRWKPTHSVNFFMGMWLQAKSLPMTYPGKSLITRDLVGHFLQTPDANQDTCRVPAHSWYSSGFLHGTCISLTLIRIFKRKIIESTSSVCVCLWCWEQWA